MAEESKTKLVLEAEGRGFDRVQKMVDELVGATTGKGGKGGALGAIDKILASLATNLGKVEDAVSKLDKTVRNFAGQKPGGGVPPAPSATPGGRQPQRPGHQDPSFFRGLAQGLGVGEFIPGMTRGAIVRQAAGRAAGGMVAGLASSPLTGMAGLQQSISAIPGGGVVAGALGNAASFAQRATELDRTRLEASFMYNFAGGRQAAGRAGARFTTEGGRIRGHNAEQAAIGDYLQREQTGIGMFSAYERAAGSVLSERTAKIPGLSGLNALGNLVNKRGQALSSAEEESMVSRVMSKAMAAGGAANIDAQVSYGAERTAAMGAARRQVLFGGGIRRLGQRFGMDETETTRYSAGLLRSGGGTLDQALRGDTVEAGLAAQARYGVGAETSGAFLRGTRTGGLAGGGQAADRLADSIANAVESGLEGSEISEYLERMASGIESFKETGIKVDETSLAGMTRALTSAGVAPSIAGVRAAQEQRGIQQQAMGGLPTTAAGFAALRAFGGFRGGGTKGAISALERLQTGNFVPGGKAEMARMALKSAGGDRELAALMLQQGSGKFGAPVGLDDARALIAQATGGAVSAERAQQIAQVQATTSQGAKQSPGRGRAGLFRAGREVIDQFGGALQREAGIRNRQETVGREIRPAVLDMEEATTKAAQAVSTFAPQIRAITESIGKASDQILEAAQAIENWTKATVRITR